SESTCRCRQRRRPPTGDGWWRRRPGSRSGTPGPAAARPRPDSVGGGLLLVALQLGAPEVEDLPVLLLEDVHHRPLHVVAISLTEVIRLVGIAVAGDQIDLRPAEVFRPRVDLLRCRLGDADEGGVAGYLIDGAVEAVHQRSARGT